MIRRELMEILKGNRSIDARLYFMMIALLGGIGLHVNNTWYKKYMKLNDDWSRMAHDINNSWAKDLLSGRFSKKPIHTEEHFVKEFFDELERRANER